MFKKHGGILHTSLLVPIIPCSGAHCGGSESQLTSKEIYISGSIYDTGLETFRTLHKTMEQLDIPHTYEETKDGGHIWLVWQNALPRFLSLL